MKFFLIFAFLMSISIEAQGKMCLALDRQVIKIENLVNRKGAVLSQSGRYLLYEEKRGKGEDSENTNSALMFLDLETQEKKEFLFKSAAKKNTEENERKYVYQFSEDESSVFGLAKGDKTIKVWSLPSLEEKRVSITEGRDVLRMGFLDDGRLVIVEMEAELAELAESVRKEVSLVVNDKIKVLPPTAHIFEYYNGTHSFDYFIRVVDPLTLNQNEVAFQDYISKGSCANIDTTLNRLVHVRWDGAIIATSLTEEKEPVEVFGPVKGFTLSSSPIEIARQCYFLSERVNVLQVPGKDEYIFRDLKEGKESFFSSEFLIFKDDGQYKRYAPPFLHGINFLIKYPFALSVDSSRAYHIPSGQYTMLKAKQLMLSSDGQVSFEVQISNDAPVLQVVSHPLNPYQREVVFEADFKKVCNVDIGKDGLVTVMSFEGDLFSIDVKSDVVHKKLGFPGQCFLQKSKIAGSGTVFLGVNREGEHVVNRLKEKCIEDSQSSGSDSIEESLIRLSREENPAESSYLSVLSALLEDDEKAQSYTEVLGNVFWNILLHSPTLYLELHRRYPNIGKALPVNSTYPDFGPDSLARLTTSVKFILDVTTSTINYTPFSDWDFLRMLKPVLQKLLKKDRELYMERITVSISNGAAKEIPLLQDVFQSKIYYVVKEHIKELFGLERQRVSDISVIRREAGGMATLILSSDVIEVHSNTSALPSDPIEEQPGVSTPPSDAIEEQPDMATLPSDPIEEHSDVATDFGLHYALIEEVGPKELESKEGTTLDRLIEWGLSGGKSYRAKVNVHVRNNYSLGRATTPDYHSIWKDHKMVGVVVIGSSLRDFTGQLTEQYLSYFKEEGFQFSSTEDTDLKAFLLDRIGNCEVDYFLKESHSDGDERNVFRFSRGNHIVRGLRYKEGGLIEVVYIIFPRTLNPEEDSLGTDLLSNKELGQAIAEREARNCGQVTYFNTSCWSHVKARYEIEAVNSFLFLNIPSTNLSDTFANTEDNALRILLDSYRKGLDFKAFRNALAANTGYGTGNRNRYIFPDETLYSQKILSHIFVPLDIQIQLERREGETWKTINPDEAL